jgi:hypothetical protein
VSWVWNGDGRGVIPSPHPIAPWAPFPLTHPTSCLPVQGYTALDRAVAGDHKDAVRYLLARPGIKPKQECMKTTPLKRAVESKSDDPYIVRMLAETQVACVSRLDCLCHAVGFARVIVSCCVSRLGHAMVVCPALT